ncbi:hypothetical protein GC163_24695 [bacterium]|nr:hypothetical protein [bacterium]
MTHDERPPPWWTRWDQTLQTGANLAAALVHWGRGTPPRSVSGDRWRRPRRRWRRWIIIEELEEEEPAFRQTNPGDFAHAAPHAFRKPDRYPPTPTSPTFLHHGHHPGHLPMGSMAC